MKPLIFLGLSLAAIAQTPVPVVPLVTATATTGPWEKVVTLPAEALPFYRVHLGTPATGWVDKVQADIGSRVKKGDLLAEIRAPELSAASEARAEEARAAKQMVSMASAILLSAKALAAAAKSESSRISSLAKSGTVTSKARDEAASRLAAAEAKVSEAEAGILASEAEALAAAARANEAAAALEYTKITAPFDGLVVERRAELGDFLGPASKRENLFTLEQIDPIRIRIQIPEHAAALADAGDSATLRIAGQEITSKLARLAGSLDPVTKTMAVEIDLPASSLLPGVLGNAILHLEKIDQAILVPLAALQTATDGARYVIVLDGKSQREIPVTLAAIDGRTAILTLGPANGEKVVIP